MLKKITASLFFLMPLALSGINNRPIFLSDDLILSMLEEDYSRAESILSTIDPNFVNWQLRVTPLYLAVHLHDDKFVKLLIKYGADIDYQTPESGNTPLIQAAIDEDFNSVVRLLQLGANPLIVNDEHKTAFDYVHEKPDNSPLKKVLKNATLVKQKM